MADLDAPVRLSDGLLGGYLMFIVVDPCGLGRGFWRGLYKSMKVGQGFVVFPTHSFEGVC